VRAWEAYRLATEQIRILLLGLVVLLGDDICCTDFSLAVTRHFIKSFRRRQLICLPFLHDQFLEVRDAIEDLFIRHGLMLSLNTVILHVTLEYALVVGICICLTLMMHSLLRIKERSMISWHAHELWRHLRRSFL